MKVTLTQKRVLRFLQDNTVFVIALLLWFVPSVFLDGFGTGASLTVLLKNLTMWGVMALGMTFVLVLGERDLSMGMYVSMCTVIVALVSNAFGMYVGIVASVVGGLLCGLLNGLIITKLHINSFIATLGTQLFFKGMGLLLCNNRPIYVIDTMLTGFFEQKILTIGSFTLTVPMLIVAIMIVLGSLFFKYTRTGQAMFVIGGNREAGIYAGIKSDNILIFGFTMAGLIGGIAAVFVTSMQCTGNANIGERYALQSIAACVLGGVKMSGGYGKVTGAVTGALVIQLITKIIYFFDASLASLQNGIIGLILIIVLIVDQMSVKKEK